MENCPLTNKPCPNGKNLHLVEFKNGEYQQLELCNDCGIQYAQKNKPLISPTSLHDLIEVVDGIIAIRAKKQDDLKTQSCSNCGSTLEQIYEKSRFGCSECYSRFSDLAKEFFSKCQDGIVHNGKRTSSDHEELCLKNIDEQIFSLRQKIKKAIDVENYEIAAMLKKKIEELKTKGLS